MTTEQPSNSLPSDMRIISAAAEWTHKPIRSTAATYDTQPEFQESDYYDLRPGSAIPSNINKIMEMAELFYYQNGLLRSIIDLIVEFAIDGVSLYHNDPEMLNFYKIWSAKVCLRDRAERFATELLRSGNVIVQRFYADVPKPIRNRWMRTEAGVELYHNELPDKDTASIPIRYFFYRPSNIELVGDEAGAYSVKKKYGLRVDPTLYSKLKVSLTELEKKVKRGIPKIIEKSGDANFSSRITLALPNEDLYVAHYKKDDYNPWAYPITYSILPDLIYNKKLKFVKTAAIEGFNNPIRLWKLGDHKEGILPSPTAADTLQEVLQFNTGGGFKDVIWDTLLTCEVFYPPIEKLANLVEDKDPILTCFGLADDLVGGIKGSGGQSTNAYRVKSFIKKIQNIRAILTEWITFELMIIRQNLNFDDMPIIRFKFDDLTDDRVYLTLLRELADRNILSDKTMLERVGESPEIERQRITEEEKMRDSGKMPPKPSPFHNPNLEQQHEMKMEEDALNMQNEVNKKPTTNKNGRPPGAKDKMPRVKKSKAEEITQAGELYNKIYSMALADTLKILNLNNARQLTASNKKILLETVDKAFACSIIDESDNIVYDESRYDTWKKLYKEYVTRSEPQTLNDIITSKVLAYVDLGV